MQNIVATWSALSLRRKAVILGATLAMFAAVLLLGRIAGRADMALLYASLEPAAAGEVVSVLEQRGVLHEVRGTAIYVDASQRDSLRMALAAEGLPAAGGEGYELLDSLSGFSTTSQMFDAAYWRAKEGELARTLLAMPQIRAARVHLANPPARPFQQDALPSASVTLTTASGNLPDAQARAIRHLVASAVAGLTPDAVQIIDTVGGLIGGRPTGDVNSSDATERATAIKGNVERLLAVRVGPGKAVVEVAVDLVSERETISERVFDPQGRVAISQETEERSGNSTEPGGEVTVASNLPEGDAGQGAQGQSQSSETRERVNYEVSETQREVLRAPGGVRRMTVAVMVDGVVTIAADGTRSWSARTEEDLAALRELVASAVGLDEARGDVLTLKSLEFQDVVTVDAGAASPGLLPMIGPLDIMSLIQTGVLAIVALVLGLFVLRPVLATAARPALGAPGATLALPSGSGHGTAVLDGEVEPPYDVQGYSAVQAVSSEQGGEDAPSRLRRLIEERQTESIEILRNWMERDEERV